MTGDNVFFVLTALFLWFIFLFVYHKAKRSKKTIDKEWKKVLNSLLSLTVSGGALVVLMMIVEDLASKEDKGFIYSAGIISFGTVTAGKIICDIWTRKTYKDAIEVINLIKKSD